MTDGDGDMNTQKYRSLQKFVTSEYYRFPLISLGPEP